MASQPTTQSQVQAYQFVLRRMESALVRKDAVMLHDPMASHKRATVVGVLLAAVGCIGFLVWGLFGGKGSVPNPGSIVIGKQSGSVYVVATDPQAQKRLIPMLNMTSAKLLVMGLGQGQGGQAPQPTTVNDAALADFPRGPRTGMINAPDYLPSPNNVAAPSWSVCDAVQGGGTITTVIGGADPQGIALAPNQSLYVQDQTSHRIFLVYVPASAPGQPNTAAVKAEVDQSQSAVMDMFGLSGVAPRPISTNMLNAIPTVPALTVPSVPGRGQLAGYMHSANPYRVGDIVKETVNATTYRYYVLLRSGKQQISEGAAAVLNAARSGSGDMPNGTNALSNADNAQGEHLAVDSWPAVVPKPVPVDQFTGSCLTWKNVNGDQNITVNLNKGNPAAKPPVQLAQFDGVGSKLDYFYMPPGQAAVVRGAANQAGADSGPLYLVADDGVKYGIKDVATAQGLGVINGAGDIKAAPASIMASLPTGDFLDPAQASFVYDSITAPTLGVNRPLPSQNQNAG
jgi:type VII secretion protein EccB